MRAQRKAPHSIQWLLHFGFWLQEWTPIKLLQDLEEVQGE